MSSALHHNSSHSSPSAVSWSADLPPAQAQVVAALAEGRTVSAAARDAGVHRTTIHNWLRTLPEFARSVEQARTDYRGQLADELTELAASALSTLRTLLDDPETPSAVRLKAALAVLQRPRFPDRGWSLPSSIETPGQQKFAEDLALLAADYKSLRMTEALGKASPAESDAAVESEPAAAETATPRNTPCPCGSRLKYKRCCGRNAPPTVNTASASHAAH